MFYPLAHIFPATEVLSDSMRLFSSVSIMPPLFVTPLPGDARVPFYLVGDVVEF